jgi:hypothetical protein
MVAVLVAVALSLPTPAGADPFNLSMASYLGDAGSADAAVGLRILSDGTLVVAANAGGARPANPGEAPLAPVLLAGSDADTPGLLLRLSRDGRTLLSVTRLAAELRDLDVDAADNLYVAAGDAGVYKLDPAATAISWQLLAGEYIERVAASPGGWVAAHRTNTRDTSTPGSGLTHLINPAGAVVGGFGGLNNTLDVAVDEPSQTVVQVGWRQANAWQEDGSGVLPVQIAYLRGLDFAGAVKWHLYGWQTASMLAELGGGNAFDGDGIIITNPHFLNSNGSLMAEPHDDGAGNLYPRYQYYNNMADTRGYRVRIGRDGLLYAGFEAAGGNHIFRHAGLWDADDPAFRASVPLAGGGVFNQWTNTGASHKTYIGRYDPASGEILTGNQFNTVVTSGGTASANTLRIREGGLAADQDGNLYFGAAAASGLPTPASTYFSPMAGEVTLNPFGISSNEGGAYIWATAPNLATRRFVGRISSGTAHAVDARILAGETEPVVAWVGRADLNRPMFTRAAFQSQPGYGEQDGFVAVLGGDPDPGDAAAYTFVHGGPGADYTGGTTRRPRGVEPTRTLEGWGSRVEYGWNPDIALSPPPAQYSGTPYRGGIRADFLDTTSLANFSTRNVQDNLLSIRVQPNSPVTADLHAVIFFDRADLPDVEPGDVLSFDNLSYLEVRINGDGAGRWLVRDGDTFYVSEETYRAIGSGIEISRIAFESGVDHGRWAPWDDIDAAMNFDAQAAIFENRRFENISAVGFIIDKDPFNSARVWPQWNGFTVRMIRNGPVKQPPVPVAISDHPGPALPPHGVAFDGGGSHDPDGSISFLRWTFDNGAAIAGPAASTTYGAAGVYRPVLTVYDNDLIRRDDASLMVEVFAPAVTQPAATVASWGGDMVSGTSNFRNDGQTSFTYIPDGGEWWVYRDGDDNPAASIDIRGFAFSDTSPLTTFPGTRLYGGLLARNVGTTTGFADRGVRDSADVDNLVVRHQASTDPATPSSISGLFFIDKADFIGAARSEPVRFTAGSRIVVSGVEKTERVNTVRWVVREGETYHVSEEIAFTGGSPGGDYAWTCPGDADHGRWAEYDPGAAHMAFDPATAVFETRVFSDLTAFGILLNRITYENGRTWFAFRQLHVEAATGPAGRADGIPMDWIIEWFGGNDNAPEDVLKDGRMVPLLEAYLLGGDPLDPNDFLRIEEVMTTSGGLLVRFPSHTGRLYQIESSPDLSADNWTPLGDPVAGDDDLLELLIEPATDREFFRLRVSLP